MSSKNNPCKAGGTGWPGLSKSTMSRTVSKADEAWPVEQSTAASQRAGILEVDNFMALDLRAWCGSSNLPPDKARGAGKAPPVSNTVQASQTTACKLPMV